MNVVVSVSNPDGLVSLSGKGDLTLVLAIETLKKVIKHPDYQSHYSILGDLREAQKTLSLLEMKPLACFLQTNKDNFKGKWALVVRPERAKISSMLAMLTKPFGIQMEVFNNPEEALNYLS